MELDHPPLMICEFLSAKSGQGPPETFPSKNNRCKAGGGLDKLSLEKQAELCLGPGHANCPLRLKAAAAQFAPPLAAAEPLPPGESARPARGADRGGEAAREDRDETIDLPIGDVFEPSSADFEEASEPPEELKKDKHRTQASEEQPSQPFRRELADWMRGLFKDKRNS